MRAWELAARGGLLQSLAQATLALMAPFGQLVLMLTARPILHRLRYSRAVLATERQIESVCDFEPPQMAILTFHQQSERGSRGIDVLGALHYRLSSVSGNTILGPTVEEVSGKADSSAAASSSTLRASTVRSSTVAPPRVSQAPSREEGEGEAPSGKAGAVAPSEKPLQAQLGGGRLRQCLTGLDQVVALVRARNASAAGAVRGPPPTRRASSGTEMMSARAPSLHLDYVVRVDARIRAHRAYGHAASAGVCRSWAASAGAARRRRRRRASRTRGPVG